MHRHRNSPRLAKAGTDRHNARKRGHDAALALNDLRVPCMIEQPTAPSEWANAWAGFDADAEWRGFTADADPINAALLCCDRHAVGGAIAAA